MALPPGPWLPGDHGHWCNLSALCVGGVAVWPGARVGGRTAALLALSWVLLCKQTAVTHPVGLAAPRATAARREGLVTLR